MRRSDGPAGLSAPAVALSSYQAAEQVRWPSKRIEKGQLRAIRRQALRKLGRMNVETRSRISLRLSIGRSPRISRKAIAYPTCKSLKYFWNSFSEIALFFPNRHQIRLGQSATTVWLSPRRQRALARLCYRSRFVFRAAREFAYASTPRSSGRSGILPHMPSIKGNKDICCLNHCPALFEDCREVFGTDAPRGDEVRPSTQPISRRRANPTGLSNIMILSNLVTATFWWR